MIARDRAKLIFHASDKSIGAFEPLERGGEAVQVFDQAEIRHRSSTFEYRAGEVAITPGHSALAHRAEPIERNAEVRRHDA